MLKNVLICTDLDGTLLRTDKSISERNLCAIERFKAQGGRFTVVTGRMPSTARAICEKIRPNAPVGCINGGGLYDFDKNEYVCARSLDKRAFILLEHIVREVPDIGIQVNTHDHVYFAKDSAAMEEFRRLTGAPRLMRSYKDIDEPIGKIIFGHLSEEVIERVAALLSAHELSGEFDFIRSERMLYEILPKGVNKGLSVRMLSEHLGIPRDRIIAVGDYDNDASMLREAGIGIAVANAAETAKRAADIITVSNDDDAIARVIEDLENGSIIIPDFS